MSGDGDLFNISITFHSEDENLWNQVKINFDRSDKKG